MDSSSVLSMLADNCAARLHGILLQVRLRGGQIDGGAPRLRRVWDDVLKVPDGDLRTLYLRLADVQTLAREVRQTVENTPTLNPAIHLRYAERWEGLLAVTNLDIDFRQYKEHVGEVVLQPLESAAHVLSLVAQEPVVEEEELLAALKELDDAYGEVRNAGLDEAVRRVILSALDDIRLGLMRYRTAGIQAFWEAWRMTTGAIVVSNHAHDVGVAVKRPDLANVARVFNRIATWGLAAKSGAGLAVTLVESFNTLMDAAGHVGKFLGKGS